MCVGHVIILQEPYQDLDADCVHGCELVAAKRCSLYAKRKDKIRTTSLTFLPSDALKHISYTDLVKVAIIWVYLSFYSAWKLETPRRFQLRVAK